MAAHFAGILQHSVPVRRMLIALGVSLLAHFLMVSGWGSGVAHTTSAVVSLQARLEPMHKALPASVAADSLPVSVDPQPAVSARRASRPIVAAAAVEQSPAGAATNGPDLRFYLARELDQYPSPLSVLNLDSSHGNARLWVSIDQAGRVVEAAVIDADPPGEFERQVRERVLVTPFMPARRDGRPVKSRILLVLGQGV